MRHAFGLRLFFIPAARERLGAVLVAAGAALYVVRAAVQMAALRAEIATADFPVFYQAAADLAHGHDPYAGFLARCPGIQWCLGGYIYPPLLAELLRPLGALDLVTADAAWTLASHIMLVAAAALAYATVRPDLPRGSGRLLLAAALFFLPLYQNLYAGSVGAPLLLLLSLSAWAHVRARGAVAGAALGAGAVLRVTPVAMGPVLLLTREDLRRPVGAAAALLTGAILMGILALMTPFTIEYVTSVLPRISAGTDFVSNISLPGVLLRAQVMLLGGRVPGSALVGTGLAVAVLAWTWWRAHGIRGRGARAAGFAAFLAATSLASSITWNYHLVNELLVLTLLAPWLGHGRRALALVLVAYPLLWVYADGVLAVTGLRPGGGLGALGFLAVTSVNAVGMVLLWLACLDVLAGLRQRPGTA